MSDKPAVSIKDMLKREPIISSGHRMCAGCAAPPVIKLMVCAVRPPAATTKVILVPNPV